LERVWKGAVVAKFEIVSPKILQELRKHQSDFNQRLPE
jgi:hypothetical protein